MSHSPFSKLGWLTWAIILALKDPLVSFRQSVKEYYWIQSLETEKRVQKLKIKYPEEWIDYNRQRMTAVALRTSPLPEECKDFSYYLFLLKTQ